MDRKLAAKFSEMKMARWERKRVCNGSKAAKEALRDFNRADRHAAKAACREALKEAA